MAGAVLIGLVKLGEFGFGFNGSGGGALAGSELSHLRKTLFVSIVVSGDERDSKDLHWYLSRRSKGVKGMLVFNDSVPVAGSLSVN